MTVITRALSTALLHFVWQGLVVAFLLWVVLFLLRRRSAQARYLVSCTALALMALLPVITAAVVYSPESHVTIAAPSIGPQPSPELSALVSPPRLEWLRLLQAWALPAWSLGVLLFSLRLVWGCRQVSQLRRRGAAADAAILEMVAALANRCGLTRPVRVLMTTAADGPSVVGWLRPIILLPSATVLGLTPQQLEAVLAHEFAHILRYDYLVNLAQMLVETVLFYHPAIWWTSARIRHERELCCDDVAVEACGDPVCYARALTRLERLRAATPSLAMSSTGGPLLYRIQRIVGAARQEYGWSKLPGVAALCVGIVCLGLNLHWANGQTPAPSKGSYKIELSDAVRMPDAPGVHLDLGGAAVTRRSPVEYPPNAVEKRIQGTVVVEATLDDSGAVTDARVIAGPSELRRSALQSVLEWQFAPAPLGTTRQVGIEYRLSEADAIPPAGFPQVLSRDGLEPLSVEIQGQAQTEMERAYKRMAEQYKQDSQDLYGGSAGQYSLNQEESLAGRHEMLSQLEKMREEQQRLHELDAQLLRQSISAEPSELQQYEALIRQQEELLERQDTDARSSDARRRAERELESMNFAGRKVDHIEFQGVPDEVRAALQNQMPVRSGDTLTRPMLRLLRAAIVLIDERLDIALREAGNGEVTIRIISPAPVRHME